MPPRALIMRLAQKRGVQRFRIAAQRPRPGAHIPPQGGRQAGRVEGRSLLLAMGPARRCSALQPSKTRDLGQCLPAQSSWQPTTNPKSSYRRHFVLATSLVET